MPRKPTSAITIAASSVARTPLHPASTTISSHDQHSEQIHRHDSVRQRWTLYEANEGDEQRDAERHERNLRNDFEHGPSQSVYSNNNLTRRSKPSLISRRVSSAVFMCMTCT